MTTASKVCCLDDCLDPAKTKGYCARHYMWMKRNNPDTIFGERPPCKSQGCEKPTHEGGLCREHFLERRRVKERFNRAQAKRREDRFKTRHEIDNRPIPDDLWEFVKYELGLK